jgi:L,D-transpeptidase catalytic domain
MSSKAIVLFAALSAIPLTASPALAQDAPAAPAPAGEIVFQPGTGQPQSAPVPAPQPVRASLTCTDLGEAASAPPPALPSPPQRLDRGLLQAALASYQGHVCRGGMVSGPADIIVVDFAKPSSQPRLYAINLLTGQGIDTPIAVAHGVGSDRNDDGVTDFFSNMPASLASSLGAARGAERYYGQNGLSLRLDGLDPSNSNMRYRDIVAHSYAPERRRYFNASLIQARGGRPGVSEGCFVVAPEYRDWLFNLLGNGGFLFAGLSGARAKEMEALISPPPPPAQGEVVFVPGTGQQ